MKLLDYVKTREKQSRLAAKLAITPVLINQWANGKRPIPPGRCVAIELATDGEVTRPELRPDDWQRIWPELVPVSSICSDHEKVCELEEHVQKKQYPTLLKRRASDKEELG